LSAVAGDSRLGARVAAARRHRGMTQRDLARALGVSSWTVDRIETGVVDGRTYLASIADATRTSPDRLAVPRRQVARTRMHPRALPHGGPFGRDLVLGSIVLLVTIRFFTEVVPVLPRAANFVDIPIFLALACAVMAIPAGSGGRTYLRVGLPAGLFVGLAIVSAAVNSDRTEPAPVFVFLYGFLAPVAVYAAVYRLWPPGAAGSMSRVLVWLGLLQLAVVLLVDLPRFATSGNPDLISGTFGTNAYQLVFFLVVVAALLAGIFALEPDRRVAHFVPILIPAIFGVTLLAQYRALLATMVVAMLVVGILLGRRLRGIVVAVLALVAFAVAFSYVASNYPGLRLQTTASTLTESPWTYVDARLTAARPLERLYTDNPGYVVTGSGPGTFSSRAWQTFANAGSTSQSNVQGGYAQRLTGGLYQTDVSQKYIVSQAKNATALQGSRAPSSPNASYYSLAAEVGILGLVLMAGLYVLALLRSFASTRREVARARRGDPVPALALATAIAFLTLLQMGVLENWFEVTRVTFLAWAMFAVVCKELDARAERGS
jgi:transcriptional regulator with XRE-family HTH domain